MKKYIAVTALLGGLLAYVGGSFEARAQINPAVMPASGPLSKQTMARLLLTDAARIGNRVVAVGDRGYIVYSDSNGTSWQRAKTPPNTPLLTAIYFLDDKTGWAVGHDSTILTTTDRGESWSKVFSAADDQKPLMDVTFVDANRGFAVGAYGAFYGTSDGGKTWNARKMFEAAKTVQPSVAPKKGKYESVGSGKAAEGDAGGKGGDEDKHINAIVTLADGATAKPDGNKLFVAGEAGMLAKSDDGGTTWTKIASPYKGSFFGAIQAQNGAVLIYGLRGRIYRSMDASLNNWKQIQNKTLASLMGSSRLPDGTLVLAGLSGTVLVSRDNGETFSPLAVGSTKALSAPLQGSPNALLVVGEAGARELSLATTSATPASPATTPAKR